MVAPLSHAFMKLSRRAETNDRSKLVATFVNVGPLFPLLSSRDHQVMYGRRGTGKTHALLYLAETVQAKGDVAIYIDMRTMGSSGGTYSDHNIPLAERATRLLLDTLGAFYDSLFEYIISRAEEIDLSSIETLLDRLASTISEVRVVDVPYNEGATTQGSLGIVRHTVRFGSVGNILGNLVERLKPKKIWVLLDEWSSIPLELQPYLADLIRRTMLSIRGITVKVAAIEQRSRFQLPLEQGGYVGIELGADVAADINLDDFMVFENDANRANLFFQELIYKHYQPTDDLDSSVGPHSPEALIHQAFTQHNVFDEFVRSAEGVPRDAINIAIQAAQKSIDRPISMNDVRTAARNWYQRDKGAAVKSYPKANDLLHWITVEVIGQRKARAFLLKKDVKHDLIDYLFDARVLHVLKRNISTRDQPGVRYDVYKLDYGCYVDLINTARSPQYLLPLEWPDGMEQNSIEVPPDDYRSIRQAILDLEEFESQN